MIYVTDNNKIIDTDKMEKVLTIDYKICYGTVSCVLWRTTLSHNWYQTKKSSWAGKDTMDIAEAITIQDIIRMLIKDPRLENIACKYPEINKCLKEINDE